MKGNAEVASASFAISSLKVLEGKSVADFKMESEQVEWWRQEQDKAFLNGHERLVFLL